MQTAVVQRFLPAKGYGFATTEKGQTLFLHIGQGQLIKAGTGVPVFDYETLRGNPLR